MAERDEQVVVAGPDVEARARRTLERIANAALATVCADGSPWNSPVFVAFDGRAFYWSSHDDAVHSRNVAANPSVMLVVFDSTVPDETGHAVYVRSRARELEDEPSIQRALDALAKRKGDAPKKASDFRPPYSRRVYEAAPEVFWTNVVRERDGHYFDERVVVHLAAER